jgi:dipeptidyl aminopeptidase/acylaminoacyl peptidase
MKRILHLIIILIVIMQTSCNFTSESEKGFTPEAPTLASNYISPEVLWMIGRIGGEKVSPDGNLILYSITYFSKEENRSYKDLYIYNIANASSTRITNTDENEGSATWHPEGKKIGFLSKKSGNMQLWEMDTNGKNKKQISFIEGGVSDFIYSPDGSKIVFSKSVKLDQTVSDLHPDLPKTTARIENDIMYRHWDSWHDFTYNHLFIADHNGYPIFSATDILEGEKFDSPMKPFGGMEQVAFSPDGSLIAYTCKKKIGKEYSISTNSEIWIYNIETRETKNFTSGLLGYDMNPVFSPDGKYLAWESMERDGYEADQSRLFIAEIETGIRTNLFEKYEESAHNITWDKSSKQIYFISPDKATDEIFKIDISTLEITQLTSGVHNIKSVQVVNNMLLARKHSMSYPDELYLISPDNGTEEAITSVTKPIMDQLKMGKVESRWVKTTDGKEMQVWLIFPPDFDPSKKYPALLYCQGGPQGTVNQFWSYRWNFQLMAASGYIIVAPNRRGLQGFGIEWLEQISKDYGGQNIKDYLSAIDNAAAEPWVDETRLGAIGASYGGYSVFYLAGHHEKRFKTFISHAGIFNFEQMYATTEEMWFVNWDLGGAYWDKENKEAVRSYSFSPHHYVDKWDTPILVIHGENDYRIPYTQGMAAYNSAILKGIPAQFLFFHEENHWILKPQNGILWQRTFMGWLDKWLK